MKIGLGNDHGGYALKTSIKAYLEGQGHEVVDYGAHSAERTDYPAWGRLVAEKVRAGEVERGLLFCGTGLGIGIAANKVPGIRCAIVSEPYSARLAREHNDANMLSMGGRVVAPEYAEAIVDAFLAGEFEGGRHEARIADIDLQ